jgi:hypothetical protein
MRHAAVLVGVLLVAPCAATAQEKKGGDDLGLAVAHGTVEKADKDTLTIQPRGTGGKFQKSLTLHLTGTSKVAILSPRKMGDKTVLTQREGEAKDLQAGQAIAVIYTHAGGKDGPVLLTAVVQPATGK